MTLSSLQVAELDIFMQEWSANALNTRPAQHDEAERLILDFYDYKRRKPPERIVWCQSPMQAMLIVSYLLMRRWRRLWKDVHTRYEPAFWATFESAFWEVFRDSCSDLFWDDIGKDINPTDLDDIELMIREREAREEIRRYFTPMLEHTNGIRTVQWSEIWPTNTASQLGFRWVNEGGQFNPYDLACKAGLQCLFPDRVSALKSHPAAKLAKAVGWWWAYERLCIVTERPHEIHIDDQFRLHAEDKPAIVYPDGWKVYSWHGVRVPANAILTPETITVKQIEKQRNTETRRVLMERYGIQRYLDDSGAEELHRDNYGVLYRLQQGSKEPLVMLKVINSTPESDGSFREYFLRVPPHMQTAHQAVAWTFGMKAADYHPRFES